MIQLLDSAVGATKAPVKKRSCMAADDFASVYHAPVLLGEVLELLAPVSGKIFVDGTLGGGGHSEALLAAGARVIGLDQDPDAIAFAQKKLEAAGENFQAMQSNFAAIGNVLQRLGIASIDGALLDLALDMRMNPSAPVTAADLVNNASGDQLERIFKNFGEEPSARRIAGRIVRDRLQQPFATTLELARCVERVVPRRGRTHPATRIFQALRIAVNRELDVLAEALEQFTAALRVGGRFGVITFHSLEDRAVKTFFKQRSIEFLDRPEWPAPRPNPDFTFRLLTRKAVVASAAEQARNPRARSAKLRVVEKIR